MATSTAQCTQLLAGRPLLQVTGTLAGQDKAGSLTATAGSAIRASSATALGTSLVIAGRRPAGMTTATAATGNCHSEFTP